jgi:hypothetical protein
LPFWSGFAARPGSGLADVRFRLKAAIAIKLMVLRQHRQQKSRSPLFRSMNAQRLGSPLFNRMRQMMCGTWAT